MVKRRGEAGSRNAFGMFPVFPDGCPVGSGDQQMRVAGEETADGAAHRSVVDGSERQEFGGGGVRTVLRPRLGTVSCLVPRAQVPATHRFVTGDGA